jgi:hypothetical protein
MGWLPWRRKKEDTPVVTPPTPEEPQITIPDIKPSNLQFVNYIRALLILKNIPLKKLRDELKKLPWLDIFYVAGVLIWLLMTYLFIRQLALVLMT